MNTTLTANVFKDQNTDLFYCMAVVGVVVVVKGVESFFSKL